MIFGQRTDFRSSEDDNALENLLRYRYKVWGRRFLGHNFGGLIEENRKHSAYISLKTHQERQSKTEPLVLGAYPLKEYIGYLIPSFPSKNQPERAGHEGIWQAGSRHLKSRGQKHLKNSTTRCTKKCAL